MGNISVDDRTQETPNSGIKEVEERVSDIDDKLMAGRKLRKKE